LELGVPGQALCHPGRARGRHSLQVRSRGRRAGPHLSAGAHLTTPMPTSPATPPPTVLLVWGSGKDGQLGITSLPTEQEDLELDGDGASSSSSPTTDAAPCMCNLPTPCEALYSVAVAGVSCGSRHTLAYTSDGAVFRLVPNTLIANLSISRRHLQRRAHCLCAHCNARHPLCTSSHRVQARAQLGLGRVRPTGPPRPAQPAAAARSSDAARPGGGGHQRRRHAQRCRAEQRAAVHVGQQRIR
jgi:Regulator of chromosome condensation (RCC1) repeat